MAQRDSPFSRSFGGSFVQGSRPALKSLSLPPLIVDCSAYHSATPASPATPSSPTPTSMPCRTVRAGDIGFLAHDAVQEGVNRRHHIKTYPEVGISAANYKRHNMFTRLPGVTMNEKSFSSFAHTASNVQASMQQQLSPLRSGSPRRMYPPSR